MALPLNMFYNTGIATYIWVLTNRKPAHRRGKVQLIDATQWFEPLRKNLGKKNCELSEEDITCICETFLAFEETEQSKIFPNAAFGYWKVTVERPLRVAVELSQEHREQFRATCQEAEEDPLGNLVDRVAEKLGPGPHRDFNVFIDTVDEDAKEHGVKLTAKRKKLLQTLLAKRDEEAEPVIKKIYKPGRMEPDSIHRLVESKIEGKCRVVEYEPDTELRDAEQIPLLEEGGIGGILAPRSAALCPRRLVCSRQRQDWLRGQLYTVLLQAETDARSGGDPGGHSGSGEGDRGVAGGNHWNG